MARQRRQSGQPTATQTVAFTVPNGAGPSTILLDLIAPQDKCRVISAAITVKTAGTGGATASASLKAGSTVVAGLATLGANTDAAGTYETSVEGDTGKQIAEGQQMSILWTLLAGTNTTGAVYLLSVTWGL